MAALYNVTNGSTEWDEDDVNQYGAALANVFDITNTTQDAPGRLVLPSDSADPGTLSDFQVWVRDDIAHGVLFIEDSAGNEVPYRPLRQRKAAEMVTDTASNLSGSFADIASLSVSIQTSGGRLCIAVVAKDDPAIATQVGIATSAITNGVGSTARVGYAMRAVVGSTNLGPVYNFSSQLQQSGSSPLVLNATWAPPGLQWTTLPVAGTYTVKIQALDYTDGDVSHSAQALNLRLEVWEVFDD